MDRVELIMEGIIYWIAFLIYAVVTGQRVYRDRKLVVSAIAILIMLAIVGWHIFSVPVTVEIR